MRFYLESRSMIIYLVFAGTCILFAYMAGSEALPEMSATFLALGTSSAAVIGARAALRAAERPPAKGR